MRALRPGHALRVCRSGAVWFAFLWIAASAALAQGGPPLFTDDPGTPGNRHWEINIGATTDRRAGTRDYELPQLDVNYGAGDRVQLNYQASWLMHGEDAAATRSGLGNSQFAVKWRFYQNDRLEFQISTYPRLEVNNPNDSVARGLAARGTSFLLPLEVTKRVGPVDFNGEVGHWFQHYGPGQWIFGLAAGRQINPRLELVGEFYRVKTSEPGEADTTLDGGGRLRLKGPLVLLFMAGRGLRGAASGESQFVGYGGVQLLFPPPQPGRPSVTNKPQQLPGPKAK